MLELRSRAAVRLSGKRNHRTADQDAVANIRITSLRRPLAVGQRGHFGLLRKCGACAERWSQDPSGIEANCGSRRERRSNGNSGDSQCNRPACRRRRGQGATAIVSRANACDPLDYRPESTNHLQLGKRARFVKSQSRGFGRANALRVLEMPGFESCSHRAACRCVAGRCFLFRVSAR